MKGLIFDIRHYAVHDGPGIRTTVFLKGCPLACRWCHNPESRGTSSEPIVTKRRIGDKVFDENEMVGVRMTPLEVIMEAEKSRLFFDESGGGITFSGGEPLMQSGFLYETLKLCREREMHSAVDTCGLASSDNIQKIAELTDLFLFDIKLMDDQKHIKYTGVSNQVILNNLHLLASMGKKIWLRMPVIPGINDTPDDIRKLMNLLIELYPKVKNLNLLPYHAAAKSKYDRLGLDSSDYVFNQPTPEVMESLKLKLSQTGYAVKIGG
ncbi:MAG: glycyl-radical enzyme activating protein [Bacteroidota bacterium]|nr:glycyl-radical enzyme activating protein [Bacteroidota bacterium]